MRRPLVTFSPEFGRLPQEVASWVSRLLDLGKLSVLLCLQYTEMQYRHCRVPEVHRSRVPGKAYDRRGLDTLSVNIHEAERILSAFQFFRFAR